jgi:hypothetical protein
VNVIRRIRRNVVMMIGAALLSGSVVACGDEGGGGYGGDDTDQQAALLYYILLAQQEAATPNPETKTPGSIRPGRLQGPRVLDARRPINLQTQSLSTDSRSKCAYSHR